jgi:hypothetical protein
VDRLRCGMTMMVADRIFCRVSGFKIGKAPFAAVKVQRANDQCVEVQS